MQGSSVAMFRRGKQQEWAMRTMLRHVPRQARRVYRRGTPLAATELGACLVHIVCSARLRVYQTAPAGDEITLALLSPASCFSLAWLDQRSRENTCAMAITETAEVVSLAEAAFRALLLEHPELGHTLCTRAMRLLGDVCARMADFALYDVATRLAHTLGTLAEAEPGPIAMTHQELAWLAGTTRPRVTQALRQLCRLGFITYEPHRRGIHVLDAEGLRNAEDVLHGTSATRERVYSGGHGSG